MVDLLCLVVSGSSLAYAYFVSLIRNRLREAGSGSLGTLFISNQPRYFKRYLELAHEGRWSSAPVVATGFMCFCAIASGVGLITVLIAGHRCCPK